MVSSEMSWTPSSSAKKRKYYEYCDTLSIPAQQHIPGTYPQSPVSYADFGREMYMGSPTPGARAVYQGISAVSLHAPMHVDSVVPQSLRTLMHMLAGAATTVHTYSTYTVGLLAGSGERFARCLQQNAEPFVEAIGSTAKRIKLTLCPEPTSSSATQLPPTSSARRISTNMNISPSASLPSQTSILHNVRETGLRRVRTTLGWVRDQQHLSRASHQMLEYTATQPAAPIDSFPSDDSFGLEAFRDMDYNINTQIASHLADGTDSVHSSDLEGFDEEDLVGFETKEEKRKRVAQEYLLEMQEFEAERQAEMRKVKGIFPNPNLFAEKLRMVCDTAASPRPPRRIAEKDLAFYDSPNSGKPVTLVKTFNHKDPMTPPYRQHVPNSKIKLVSALKKRDVPVVQESPVALESLPTSTPSPVSDSSNAAADSSISIATPTISSRRERSVSPSSSVASLDAVAGNLAVLGFSSRQSTKRLSDLEAIEQIKREHEAALAAEEAAKVAQEEAERRAIEEAKQAEERARLGIRRLPVSSIIEPLTAKWDDRLADAMRLGVSSSRSLATTSTGLVLRRRDFGHVLPQSGVDSTMGWLNDTVITAYLQTVVDYAQKLREVRRGDLPKVHAMSTFFYGNLAQRGYDSVKRWATKAKFGGRNLLKMEKIFVPINKGGNHWVLVNINPQTKTIEYFDSFHHSPGPVFDNINLWLRNELGDAFVDSEWTLLQDGGPRQHNASDCGVFATTTAKMIVLGVDPMAFSAADMPTQRRMMLAELMNGGLHGDFTPNITF
ncbi:MAG: hypothetical protein Q9209_004539 [Squamulea sp. 1 TL-2023]